MSDLTPLMRSSVPETSRSATINPMPSEPEKGIVAPEPPEIYIPACGVLCDVFWWARREPPAEQPAPTLIKNETP